MSESAGCLVSPADADTATDLENSVVSKLGSELFTRGHLGWSGETLWADSRVIFDSPAEGYKRLTALVRELKRTVMLFACGANDQGNPAAAK